MAPKDLTLTSKDMQNLAFGIQCMADGKLPPIDYDKFAQLAGYTKGSAQVMWGLLRKKIEALNNGNNASSPSTKATAVMTPVKKKATPKPKPMHVNTSLEESLTDSEDATEEEIPAPTPSKKRKAPSKSSSDGTTKASPVKRPKTEPKIKTEAEDNGEPLQSVEEDEDFAKILSVHKMLNEEYARLYPDSPTSQRLLGDGSVTPAGSSPGFEMGEWIHEEYIVANRDEDDMKVF